MDSSETELVRKVLASLIDRLDGRAGNSLVVIVLGQDESPAREPREPESMSSHPAGTDIITNRTGATHPGLERFTLSHLCSSGPAPRACFLEPEKVCVNSGACEVRGY